MRVVAMMVVIIGGCRDGVCGGAEVIAIRLPHRPIVAL
jgi:hypothetical protein